MKRVRPALDLHVDGGSAGKTLLGVEAAGHHVDRLERFERGDVGRHVRQPDVGRAHAVDADVVRAAARAVDVEHEGTRRVGRHRVRLRRWSESGQDAKHVLIVPVEGYRQIHQLPRLQLGSDLGAVRLEHRRIGRDGDVLAELPDLHRGVDSCDVVQRYRYVLAGEGAEPGQLDRHGVRPGLDRRKPIRAVCVATASCEAPVSLCVIVTVAPGTAPPELSVMLPTMEP